MCVCVWNNGSHLLLILNKSLHLTLSPGSPFSPFSPRGPGLPWENITNTVNLLSNNSTHPRGVICRGLIRSVQGNQEARGCRWNRYRRVPGRDNSLHLSDTCRQKQQRHEASLWSHCGVWAFLVVYLSPFDGKQETTATRLFDREDKPLKCVSYELILFKNGLKEPINWKPQIIVYLRIKISYFASC